MANTINNSELRRCRIYVNDIVDVYYNDNSKLNSVQVVGTPSNNKGLYLFNNCGLIIAQNPNSSNFDRIEKMMDDETK